MTSSRSHRLLAVGLLISLLVAICTGLFVPFVSSLFEVRADIVSIEARLNSLRERLVDSGLMRARAAALKADPLAGGGFLPGSDAEAAQTLAAGLRSLPGSSEADVSPLATIKEDGVTALRVRYGRTVAAADIEDVIAAIEAARPLLFVEEARMRRLRDADPNGGRVQLTITLRAYADGAQR